MVELSDNAVFCLILSVSLPLAHVTKIAKSGQIKRTLSTTAGVVIVYLACGFYIFHSLVTVLVNIAIIKLKGPRKCHVYSFIWCFGYLLFFRTCHYLGFSRPPSLSNAIQLFVTLRMVGVAFELHDTHYSKHEDCSTEDTALKMKYQEIDPTAVNLVHYSYCFLGQFTGPYYKYRTYIDMIENDDSSIISTIDPVLNRMKPLLIIIPCYHVFAYFFSLEPFWFRLLYMVPIYIIFRCRLYFAWLVSECSAIASSLGAYPVQCKAKYGQGPSDLKALDQCKSMDKNSIQYDFETIHNLDIYRMELAPKVRDGIRSWNMTVQYWFANYVYRRIPKHFKAYSCSEELMKCIRVGITMAVSAFWHGVHPGYYLSFSLVPIYIAAEDRMVAIYRSKDEKAGTLFDWINWFFKMRGFEYMTMAFLLLRLDLIFSCWKSMYFIGHIVSLGFLAIGFMSPLPKRKVSTCQ